MTDWLDQRREGHMRAVMVSPNNPDIELGELTGINWATAAISGGYYTTARTSAALTAKDTNWVENSFIRIIYEIPEWDYTRELGTYFVANDNSHRKNGCWETSFELHSMLAAIDAEIIPDRLVIQPGTCAIDVIKHILDEAERPYTFQTPLHDKRFQSATILDGGVSRLTRLSSMCSTSNNRLDVTGHGLIQVAPYVSPDSKTPKLNLSLTDPRGIVFDGLDRYSNRLELPNQAAVAYRYTITDENGNTYDEEITATVTAGPSSPNSASRIGYKITHYQELTEMSPATHARAEEIARANLANNTREKTEWNLRSKYLPLWTGDVITLDIPDGVERYAGRRKCLVKNVDIAGPFGDTTYTLKETSGGDEE